MQTREAGSRPAFIGPRVISVRALTYGPPDSYRTSWKLGVFADSFRSGKTIPVCWGHDNKQVVGSVISHVDRPDGLDLELRLADPDDVPAARMVASLLRDGHIEGVSVAFADGVTEPDPVYRGVQRFTRASLREVSFVTTASVPDAKVLAMRSAVVDRPAGRAAVLRRLDELIARADRLCAREQRARDWAMDVAAKAKARRPVSAADACRARAIIGGSATVTPEPTPPRSVFPPVLDYDMQAWLNMSFSAADVEAMAPRHPHPPPLPDCPTPDQLKAYGVGVTITRPMIPRRISRDLWEAAMNNPGDFPGFDPVNGHGMDIAD